MRRLLGRLLQRLLPLLQLPPMPNCNNARAASASGAPATPSPRDAFDFEPALRLRDLSREKGSGAADRTLTPQGPPALPPAAEQSSSASPKTPPKAAVMKAAWKAPPNAAPLIAAPRLVEPNDTPMMSRTPAPPAAAPPAAEKAAPTPPKAAPEAPSAAAAAAATSQRLAPSTAAAAAAATSQRLSQSAPVAASSAAAPAAAQGTKTRWYDVDLESGGDEVDGGRPPRKFEVDGPPVVRVVTREKDEWRMMQVSPVVKVEAMEYALRSERPLLRIAALATFGRGGVRARAGLVR